MLDYLLTALLPLAMLVILFYGNKPDRSGDFFFSKDYTTVLKGLCCIFIVIGHTPEEFKNMFQDALSSFGYVRVTLFFMMTGYGISLCADRKAGYMKTFWRNRLASLLIPGILVNICAFCIHKFTSGQFNAKDLIFIDPYISVLLQYYLFFYVVHHGKRFYGETAGNVIVVAGVTISSLLDYLLNDPSSRAWPYERMGLVWGMLLYHNFGKIKEFIKPRVWNIATFLAVSLLLGVLYVGYKHVYFWCEYLLKIVLGAAIVTLVFIVSSNRTWGNRAMSFFGDIYYEVFLSHMVVIEFMSAMFPEASSGVFILSVAAATIVLSAALHYTGKPLIELCRAKKTDPKQLAKWK